MSFYTEPSVRYGEKMASYASSFRDIAFTIDANPARITDYYHLPAIDYLLADRNSTALERTEYLEVFSYGDPGVLLACPGPSLSGLMLRELGLPEQIDYFYNQLKEKKMRTFFALSEPDKGSDANNIQTRIIKKNAHYYLNGVKSFFGNGAVGDMGIVLARLFDGPVGIRAVWLTPEILENAAIKKSILPMFSLCGAQISLMNINDVEIPENNILGNHLSPCENGLLGIIKVFNRLRTGVGALAIGQAQAVYDTTFQLQKNNLLSLKSIFSQLNTQLIVSRHLLQDAAKSVDKNALECKSVSISKANATKTAEAVIEACIDLCSISQLLENPWLLKSYRDMFCWEYMEGTTAIQKKQISRELPAIIKEMK